MRKSRPPHFILIPLLLLFLGCCLLSQLQPLILSSLGAVGGTFGVRPQSHRCVGLSVSGDIVQSLLPPGDIRGHISIFRYRYFVPYDAGNPIRRFCIGQDLWDGE